MVNIAGYELNMFGSLSNVIVPFFWGVMIFIAVGIIGYVVFVTFRNKAVYTNPVSLTVYYENGTKKTHIGLKGGKFINRHGTWDFKVKIPKQFKKKELGYVPDYSKADADGTIHFITWGDGTIWQQVEHKLVSREVIQETVNGQVVNHEVDLLIKPIRSEIKAITINSMKNWSELVNKNKVTAFAIGLAMFVIMVIAHLISLFIQTKIRCGTG